MKEEFDFTDTVKLFLFLVLVSPWPPVGSPLYFAVAEMGNRLTTIDMGRKVRGTAVPLSVHGPGKLCPNLTQCRLGRGLPLHQVAS